jgi:TolB-like protein
LSQGIFISYSRDDQKQALALLAMLRREGHNVWIDQEAIPGASIWSDEIVQNIKSCDIFIALLSESSVNSPNVAKEIGLAAENGKTILPIEIGTVALPGRLEYALAGIQRTSYHNEEAILHAIERQAAKSEEPHEVHKHRWTRRKRNRLKAAISLAVIVFLAGGFFFMSRKSVEKEILSNKVVVLPFVTMNLDQDSLRNLDVFSDAIITRISSITGMTSAGTGVTSAYKDSRLSSIAIAHELKARYIIEGLVRKKSGVDFISARIYDLKTGGEIWEQFYTGNNMEVLSIREKVSQDVFDYLRAASDEEQGVLALEKKIIAEPTNANVLAELATHLIGIDNIRSLDLFQKAIKYDSTNEQYYIRAGIVADRQKNVDLAHKLGSLGVEVVKRKLQDHPDNIEMATTYCIALDVSGQIGRAEVVYDSLVRLYPKNGRLLFNASCNFSRQGKAEKALDALEKLLTINPGKLRETRSDPDFDNVRMYPRYARLMDAVPTR